MPFSSYKTLEDLKKCKKEDLDEFSSSLRTFIIETVSKTGGHLGASLGVVELTVALHYVFNSPKDKIIWDIGHQVYPHKALTGRKDSLSTIRQENGLSGFTNIFESEHDIFGAGHSSTSISAGLGIAAGLELQKNDGVVVCVIGDGAMSAGMAFEALNNAFENPGKVIIILNDNNMSISNPTGAISQYFSQIAILESFRAAKSLLKKITPSPFLKYLKTAENAIKMASIGNNLFESLSIPYYGPIDGHDVIKLTNILEELKTKIEIGKPILLHIKTQKGKGYSHAEKAHDKFHGVSAFCVETGIQNKSSANESYSQVASRTLLEAAIQDSLIVAVTPAMKAGSCLENFASKIPSRFFDVGIAEQHAVTFSAGLARANMKPYCFIYSTFLQRGYDQLIHDVALQNLPVRFIIDRAGIVGEDGATHNGVFDIAFLRIIPNMVICCPSSKEDLEQAITFSTSYNSSPIAIRFPRGESFTRNKKTKFELGKGEIISKGEGKLAILTLGITLKYAIEEVSKLEKPTTIIDLRFVKPLDEDIILQAFKEHENIILLEDGSIGGIYSLILELLHKNKLPSNNFHQVILPDKFIEHASINSIHSKIGLKGEMLLKKIQSLNGIKTS